MTATNVDALRQGWEDAVSTLAPGVDELPILLETRLAEAVRDRRLDEPALLSVVDEAWRVASKKIAPEESGQLARRMQQAIYEYLLSLDAIVEPEEDPIEFAAPGSARAAILIGAEELAELRGEEPAELPPPVELEAAVAQPEAVDSASDVPTPSVEAVGKVTADEPAATAEAAPEAPTPVVEAAPEAEVEAPAVDAEAPVTEATSDPEATPEPEPLEPPKRRFTLFKQSGSATSLDADERADPADAEPDAAVDAQKTFVAPKAGFHITEFSDAAAAARPPAPPDAGSVPLPPPIARSAEPAPARSSNGNGNTKSWHIRNLRPGRKPRDEAAASEPAADDAADESDDLLDTGLAVSESRFDTDPDVVEARRQINDRLRHRRCDEAASLLQRLATELGGKDVAELALDAGDRCRALGKNNAALSCYLAASRADPVHETPLLRLADICLDDKDIDLAVSYLERVARLHRLRGDQKGALRVYRKIATVAPYRDDVMNLLMHVQATGRFEDE